MGGVMEKRKEILLGLLLAAIAVVMWRNLGGEDPAATAGSPRGRPSARVDLGSVRVFPVMWAALGSSRPAYDPSGRNVFQYGAIPIPTPPPLTAEEKAAIKAAQERAEQERLRAEQEAALRAAEEARRLQEMQASATPPPPPRPQPPPINVKFIGYLGPPESKIAVLHDGTDFIFARPGDEVGRGVRILEIGYESIKFGYTDERFKGETMTLPMSSTF
jgi:hypothetical protein